MIRIGNVSTEDSSNESALTENASSSTVARENVIAEFPPRDLVGCDVLESRPPDRIEPGLLAQPVRDGLLAHRLAAARNLGMVDKELTDSSSELLLPASDLDGTHQRRDVAGNVVFLHIRPRAYTSVLVDVKKHACATDHKGSCIVPFMPATKKKPSTSKGLERIRTAEIGPDGKTVGQRLREAMLAHDPPYDPSRDQSRLARDCQRIYAAAYEDVGKPVPAVIQQQNIGELLRDKQSKSKYIPIIASVLGVESTWLLLGIGPRDADIHKIRNLASQIMNSLDRDSKPRK